MKRLPDIQFLKNCFVEGIPQEPIASVCEWGKEYVRLVGSARSENYDPDITPWAKEPTECTDDGVTRIVSFCKPIQSGGSAASEVAICRRIARKVVGNIQWNWETNDKALDRWDKRIFPILHACSQVREIWPHRDAFKAKKCLVVFPHCNLTVQGQNEEKNLDSDSIAFQVNEELHGWAPGHLEKADGRLTAVWNGFQMNVSNASFFGDQFHQKWSSGTCQFWEVPCPECGQYWPMRTRWDDKHPELGGLRYDSTGCKLDNGLYDYNKLEGTIRYQFPCGHSVPDNREMRRQMSIRGRYGKPTNSGAVISNRSFTLEAVSVDFIPWLKLIQQKHSAWQANRRGDPEPWWKYMRERECIFANKSEDRPVLGTVVLNSKLKKNREGIPNHAARLAAVDRQRGSLAKNQTPHWWMVIRDVDENSNSLLVWEGKCLTDDDLVATLRSHNVKPGSVAVDSGDDTTNVYQLCDRHGWNAIKGSGNASFAHPKGGRRIFSHEVPLYKMFRGHPTRDNSAEEPLFWHYSKEGIWERLQYLRSAPDIRWEVPSDISDDYRKHIEAVELSERKHPRTGETIYEVVFRSERFDLAWCEAVIAMMMEMAGFIGAREIEQPAGEYQLDDSKVYRK